MPESSATGPRLRALNEAAKQFRFAHMDLFDQLPIQTTTVWEEGPIIGIGIRRDAVSATQRISLLEASFDTDRKLMQVDLVGASVTPSEVRFLIRTLGQFLEYMHKEAGQIDFNPSAYAALASRTNDAVKDQHWRVSALPVPIHNGDLVVLKSPMTISERTGKLQVLRAYRASPNAPMGAINIKTGKVIPEFLLQAGRVAKLTKASAQHIDRMMISKTDVQKLLAHQRHTDEDREKRNAPRRKP